MKKIILASSSPRRAELMKVLGINFEVIPSNFNEGLLKIKNPKRLVMALSLKKAQAVLSGLTNVIVIAADTVVVVKGEILLKPKSKGDAFRMLEKLSGTRHSVVTGLTIIDTQQNYSKTFVVESFVKMKILKDSEIVSYIKTGEPYDKAGSYAIQGRGGLFVEEINGDYYSIIGLPISKLREELNNLGVRTEI